MLKYLKNLYWKIKFLLAGFKYYPIGGGGTVSKDFTFSAGATIIASEHNTNFDILYNLVNGNIENVNINSAAAIANSKLNLASITQDVVHAGAFSTQGDTNIGNGADSLTINCSSGITYTPSATWTFTAGQTVSGTWTDLGIVTTVDINGGTVDGTTIGASSAAAGTFTKTTKNSEHLTETTAPSTAASEGALYTKDTSGQPELFFREESSGDEVQITTSGILKTTTSQFYTSSDTFVVPAGITTVFVTMVAGGGGGGGESGGGVDGGGGGGGEAIINIPHSVTPAASLTVTVGAGGTGGNDAAGDGGASVFDTITVSGGTGGNAGVAGVGGGTQRDAAASAVGGWGFKGGDGDVSIQGGGSAFAAGESDRLVTPGYGGGGAGAAGTIQAGGAGGAGFVMIQW